MQLEQTTATVVKVDGDCAFLKTNQQSSCGECSSKSSCGSVKLFSFVPESKYNIKVKNTLDLKAGDSVRLEMESARLLQGTLLLYLLPLLSLFVFAALGKYVGGEGVSILAGLSGLFIALFVVKKFVSQKPVSQQFVPKVFPISLIETKKGQ